MKDVDCVAFLQWCLPRLRLRWAGFRKVRRTVCKRVQRRLNVLQIDSVCAYLTYLEQHPAEWANLEALCRIPISRFCRDRRVFEHIRNVALPGLAQTVSSSRSSKILCWSAGCASGEEPYSTSVVWKFCVQRRFPDVSLSVLATDVDNTLLARARAACYEVGSLRALPPAWRSAAFMRKDDRYCVNTQFRRGVDFQLQDIRTQLPDSVFHLILCRNLVFTYFDADLQCEILAKILARLLKGGILIIGRREVLPPQVGNLVSEGPGLGVYRKR